MRHDLPTGTVTFVFTDVEGSTRLLEEMGPERYGALLSGHHRVCRAVWAEHGGVEVDTTGDGFFVAFPIASAALAAAADAQLALAELGLQVRMGMHTGEVRVAETGYVGLEVHRAARIAAAAHGGQVVVSQTTAALVAQDDLIDLGDHRFKDLAAPERVYQLGVGDFPPLRSLSRSNLPVPATTFLGRERELREVAGLLGRPDVRLLTLTGPGGTGKTRLALQAVAEAADAFLDGVRWVPLAPLRDPTLVAGAVAQAVDVKEEPGQDVLDLLAERLAGKRALLLLDNAEHLLPDLAAAVSRLHALAGLTLVVTSRERLKVAGEHVYPVPELEAAEGVELFVTRAAEAGVTVGPTAVVEELCARLEQLPLALELAAARSVLFSPEQLLERLSQRLDLLKGGRDSDPRQQTLRATIEWSYDLLDADEQRLLRSLSVFTGGCTYDAAEQVAEADVDALQSLLDKSLVRRRDTGAGPRYWMLETVRDYAAARLDAGGEATLLRRRHATWFRDLVVARIGFPGLGSGTAISPEVISALSHDVDNIRGALAWSADAADDELGLVIGAACVGAWMASGRYHEAASWLAGAAPRIPSVSRPVQLQAHKAAGLIAFLVLADSEAAEAHWAAAHAVAVELDEAGQVVWLQNMLAGIAWERGELESALAWREQNLAGARAAGNRPGEANALHWLGEVLRDLGRLDDGEEALLEAQGMYRDLGAVAQLAMNTHSLGDLALDRSDPSHAIALYREAMAVRGTVEDSRLLAYALAGIASALADQSKDESAALVWGAVCAAEDAFGFRMLAAERRRYESRLARLENSAVWEEGRSLALPDVLDSISDLD